MPVLPVVTERAVRTAAAAQAVKAETLVTLGMADEVLQVTRAIPMAATAGAAVYVELKGKAERAATRVLGGPAVLQVPKARQVPLPLAGLEAMEPTAGIALKQVSLVVPAAPAATEAMGSQVVRAEKAEAAVSAVMVAPAV